VLVDQNWGFGVKMDVFPRAEFAVCCQTRHGELHQSVKLAMASKRWPWQVGQFISSCFCRFRVLGSI